MQDTALSSTALSEAALVSLRRRLLRQARYALPDASAAEDIVQDTLVDVLAGEPQRRGDSVLSTWAIAILRHKVADWYRAPARRLMVSLADDDAQLPGIGDGFTADGSWASPVPHWQQPEQAEERRQMMGVLRRCIERLPAQTGRVFLMREWLGFETDEISERLGSNANNVRQILHRARMGMRGCMQRHWFDARGAS